MRPIDADALKESVRRKFKALPDRCEINELVNDAPTVDAIPVEWIRSKIIGAKKDAGAVIHDGVLKELLFDWNQEQKAR